MPTKSRRLATLLLLAALTALGAAPEPSQLTETDLKAAAPSPHEDAWRAVLTLAGARLGDKQSLTAVIGTLPTDEDLQKAHALIPQAFLDLHRQSNPAVQKAMEQQVRARLFELSRRGVFNPQVIDGLLRPRGEGVPGSKLYEIPPVPAESFTALVEYIQLSATIVSGGNWHATEQLRQRITDQLRVSLAVSLASGRSQYQDFDVIYALVRRDMALTPEAERRDKLPGLLWLYAQVRDPAGLSFLPPLPPALQPAVDEEAGAWFSRAREISAVLPPSLAALTIWPAPMEAPRGP